MINRIEEAEQAVYLTHAAIDCLRHTARDQQGKDLLCQQWSELMEARSRLEAFLSSLYPTIAHKQEAA